jgi:hypothetical protein
MMPCGSIAKDSVAQGMDDQPGWRPAKDRVGGFAAARETRSNWLQVGRGRALSFYSLEHKLPILSTVR